MMESNQNINKVWKIFPSAYFIVKGGEYREKSQSKHRTKWTKVSFFISAVTNDPNQKFNIPISIDISIKTYQCVCIR